MGEKLTRFFLNTKKNSAQNFERIIMTATKGESSTEKKKSWASIFKRTMSFRTWFLWRNVLSRQPKNYLPSHHCANLQLGKQVDPSGCLPRSNLPTHMRF